MPRKKNPRCSHCGQSIGRKALLFQRSQNLPSPSPSLPSNHNYISDDSHVLKVPMQMVVQKKHIQTLIDHYFETNAMKEVSKRMFENFVESQRESERLEEASKEACLLDGISSESFQVNSSRSPRKRRVIRKNRRSSSPSSSSQSKFLESSSLSDSFFALPPFSPPVLDDPTLDDPSLDDSFSIHSTSTISNLIAQIFGSQGNSQEEKKQQQQQQKEEMIDECNDKDNNIQSPKGSQTEKESPKGRAKRTVLIDAKDCQSSEEDFLMGSTVPATQDLMDELDLLNE